jgi:hypothetical protein
VGLIQFCPWGGQQDVGMNSSELAALTPTEQMKGPVLTYLSKYKDKYGNLDTVQSVFMAVFYPKYINEPGETQFPSSVPVANPGIYTPDDYIGKAHGQAQLPYQISTVPYLYRKARLSLPYKLMWIAGIGLGALWGVTEYEKKHGPII